MARVPQELFEQKSMGVTEAATEGVKVALEGFREGLGQLWDAAKPMFDHGRTEAAAALFQGNAHVMYMRGTQGIEQGQDQPLHGPSAEATQQQEMEKQQDRGGMGM